MVKFYEEAVTESCHRSLDVLEKCDFTRDFYLAGGTALALQIGHRVSTDLDWFSTTNLLPLPVRQTISQRLSNNATYEIVSEQDGMLFTRLEGTDVSLIHQQHPLLKQPVEYRGVQLASPTDIGMMKLAAVNSRGTRRDFVDLYCLQDIVTLDELLELVPEKYANRPNFLAIAARALAYHEDAERQPMPHMLRTVQWDDVKSYCLAAAERLIRRFSPFG